MKIYRRFCRICAWLIWFLLLSVGLVGFFSVGREYWWYPLLSLIFPIFGTVLVTIYLYGHPKVLLRQEGVCVKWWLRTRFYPWSHICQVGISCFYPKGYYINRLVLVRTGCSKRGYRDFLFYLRNFGKLIYIPARPYITNFVRSCYGPLDFDLTDGRVEQSIVDDE
jgi:hypothetical protein